MKIDKKKKTEKRNQRLIESGGYHFKEWNRVDYLMRDRLSVFGLDYNNFFQEVEICGPEVYLHKEHLIKENKLLGEK